MSTQRKYGVAKDTVNTFMIEFEPSSYYLYEKLKHNVKSNTKTDRLTAFLKRKQQWESDPFIFNNHVTHNNQSKEGRKLMLCEFNKGTKGSSLLKK